MWFLLTLGSCWPWMSRSFKSLCHNMTSESIKSQRERRDFEFISRSHTRVTKCYCGWRWKTLEGRWPWNSRSPNDKSVIAAKWSEISGYIVLTTDNNSYSACSRMWWPLMLDARWAHNSSVNLRQEPHSGLSTFIVTAIVAGYLLQANWACHLLV